MIDIHSHILPGLDDGAEGLDECLKMCRIAERDGIQVIVATPHSMNGVHNVGKQSIVSGVDTLNQVLQSEGMSLSVVPGAEIHVNTALPFMYESDELVTINSTEYVLVEFPMQGIPYGFEEVYFQLRLRGARLVIAHSRAVPTGATHPESLDPYPANGRLGPNHGIGPSWGTLVAAHANAHDNCCARAACI